MDLTAELIDEVCQIIPVTGERPQRVLVRLGVRGSVASSWLRRGRELSVEGVEVRAGTLDELLLALALGIDDAEAKLELGWQRELDKALRASAVDGKSRWQGWMTRLERRFPEGYRRPPASEDRQSRSVESIWAQLENSESASQTR